MKNNTKKSHYCTQALVAFAMIAASMFVSSCRQYAKDAKSLAALDENDVKISRIDPTDWYVGMNDATLQLMVYGDGIREAEVKVSGAKLDSVVRLDSPNYLLLYLNLRGAKAGTLPIKFKLDGKSTTIAYQLKQREMAGKDHIGFTNADVLYMLMPDRFAQSADHPTHIDGMNTYVEDRSQPSLRHGGDLEGIRQHLDYFTELGVTALWFTPVLENNSPDNSRKQSTYHGYATTDYYRVDPRFGTNEQYRQLIDDAHSRGLKVVMDMIFNHCGFEHPWTSDMPSSDWFNNPDWLRAENQTPEHMKEIHHADGTELISDMYRQTNYKLTPVLDPYASQVDLAETVDGWFVPTMPDLNQRNPHVMRYLVQNSMWWIETAGIDGIRMDTYPYADRNAMASWMKTLNDEYPHFNTVGETWVGEPAYTAAWQKDSRLITQNSKLKTENSYLPTTMDFSFFEKLSQAKYEETDGWGGGYNKIYNSLVYDYLYQDPSHVMAFIENHDTDRFLGDGDDVRKLKQALALLLTMQRIPQLYYGTEMLLTGTKAVTDGNVRKDFPGGFPGDVPNCFIPDERTPEQQDMFLWLSTLLHWRQGNTVITQGRQTQFIPRDGIYVLARQHEGHTVMTIVNGTDHPTTFSPQRYSELYGEKTLGTDVCTKRTVSLTAPTELEPRAALVLEF